MYKMLSHEDFQATRDVVLQNLETGTIERCFDDSDLGAGVSGQDFSFMREGKTYNCKISLFGRCTPSSVGEKVRCHITNPHIQCGCASMVEVSVGKDTYYIPYSDINETPENNAFSFWYTRKNLIQVDNVVNGLYQLKEIWT